MINCKFESIDEFRDIEIFNFYCEMKEKGMLDDSILEILNKRSRDYVRILM